MDYDKSDRLGLALFILLAFSLPLSITFSETFYALAFLVWIAKTVAKKKSLRYTRLEIPVAALTAACVLAILSSPSPLESAQILKKLALFGLFFLLANSLDSESERGRLIDTWLLGVILASIWIFVQHLQGTSRPGGSFGYIVFGHFASMFLAMCLPLIGLKNNKRTSILSLSAFAVGIPALLFTLTRAGWMSFLVGLAVFLVVRRKWLFLSTSASALVLVGLILSIYAPNSSAGIEIRSLMRPFDREVPRVVSSNLHRWFMWKASLQMFKKHPFLGVGPRRFKEELPNYLSEEVETGVFEGRSHDHPGSLYFDYLATMGVIGLGGLLFFLFAVFRLLILTYRSCSSTFSRNLTLGVLIAFTTFCTGGFFDQTFHSSNILLNLCFLLGLVLPGQSGQSHKMIGNDDTDRPQSAYN